MAKIKSEKITWTFDAASFPVHLHREKRASWRYSFGKEMLNVRIPILIKTEEERLLAIIKGHIAERLAKKPQLSQYFEKKTYKNGDTIEVGTETYHLSIVEDNRATHTARIRTGNIIDIILSVDDTENQQKALISLLSRVIAGHQKPTFSRRVLEFNYLYFKKNIKSISFKYNTTNWGSCSSSGSLNFSTRLLFAPIDVQDYVIIHELAHLVELNHSDRFWKLVADAMPDFEEKEKWLKKNGHLCRF